MDLHHLSASSAKTFEGCEASWFARYETKGEGVGNDAASLGSACHTALERWVEMYAMDAFPLNLGPLIDAFEDAYWEEMSDASLLEEGRDLLESWFKAIDREAWAERKIVSLEVRSEIGLETKFGTIPFVYIMDRLDEHPDGEIEVVDYKSGRWQLTAEDMREDIQAKSYAMAAWLMKPGQRLYWVTFDYLRDQPISTAFRAEECKTHYEYLVALAERVIAADGTKETLGSGCRFCIRKHKCETLKSYVKVDGTIVEDFDSLVERRNELKAVQTTVEGMLKDIDGAVQLELEMSGEPELEAAGGTIVSFKSSRRRQVRTEQVVEVIGTEVALDYVRIGVGEIDRWMRTATPEDKQALEGAIFWANGRPTLTYKNKKT